MRILLLITAVISLIGCTEVYKGPRLVHYNPDWFYVRHAPLFNGSGEIDRLAAAECPQATPAQFVDAAQYYPYDLRVAVYRCQRPLSSVSAPASVDAASVDPANVDSAAAPADAVNRPPASAAAP